MSTTRNGGAVLGGDVVDPFSDNSRLSPGPRAADDDSNPGHVSVLFLCVIRDRC